MIFSDEPKKQTILRERATKAYRMDEAECVEVLLEAAMLPADSAMRVHSRARRLVKKVRAGKAGLLRLDVFLSEYKLSTDEGVALMCLAEALLRVPDQETVDRLIRDKLSAGAWDAHLGKSDSIFVNAATWGLMLTGKVFPEQEGSEPRIASALKRFLTNTGEPVVRQAVNGAMKILSKQFILGRTIDEALVRARDKEDQGYCYSFDMLGEAACTMDDADRYFEAYKKSITQIGGDDASDQTLMKRPSISIKLSALHPRYEFSHRKTVVPFLEKRLLALVSLAKDVNVSVTVDAEESERLDMSLDVFEAVFSSKTLRGWDGFGLALQSYQKRAFYLIDWLIDLSKKHQRRIPVRLIKGAYWDTEIKNAQVLGLSGYPVFTRKDATDVSFVACAKKMIAAGDAFYPQFATHNARSAATILELMGARTDFEFQCLHGMGEMLYRQLVEEDDAHYACRIYAPVGTHKELLPYLVRRLLENGANTSFVNRIIDEEAPIESLIQDPVDKLRTLLEKPHPQIPLPCDLYFPDRKNSRGVDLTSLAELVPLSMAMSDVSEQEWTAAPTVGKETSKREGVDVVSPTDTRKVVGRCYMATEDDVEHALCCAEQAQPTWGREAVEVRSECLERAAKALEVHCAELMALLVSEAGKTIADALSEVREAVDFCRYYAEQARVTLSEKKLKGPVGEDNVLRFCGRGTVLCISPWNFPLAIFTGQVAAALVAGNAVIAKPATLTPLVAARVASLFHESGVPGAILQLLPGLSQVIGKALSDERVHAVILTGSTATGQVINRTLAERKGPIVPFVAETGGQNAMIADSTVLPEQLVQDVVLSAFGSAGQRCSALRVLFLQEDIADAVIEMLKGAMETLVVGDPCLLSTDVGPVIGRSAHESLQAHVEFLQSVGTLIHRVELPAHLSHGTFFAPHAYEIDSISQLKEEVFGPILHVVRYAQDKLDTVIDEINNTGYGLTLGIHSRIDQTVQYIVERAHVGNIYVNRNMIGAVVGVQPFGGEGLSGTGPKAGGPHYLLRLCKEHTLTTNTAAVGGNASLMMLED